MEGTKELITTDAIRNKVYILRGQFHSKRCDYLSRQLHYG